MVRRLRAEGLTDTAVMEVAQVGGIRTRRRERGEAMVAAAAANSTLAKRRKVKSDEVKNSSSCIQLRNRAINIDTETVSEDRCSSPGLELLHHDRVSSLCCSSHGSSERIELVDLKDERADAEVETSTCYDCRGRRDTTPSNKLEAESEAEAEAEAGEESDDLNSTTKPSSEANSRRRSTVEKTPTESEIEDIFVEAEKKLVNQFSDKYNFDFVKEEPMDGLYEWIRSRQ